MSRAGNGDDLRRLSAEILGPHDHLEFHRFRWLRSAMGRLGYPWDALLVSTMAGGLYATALSGHWSSSGGRDRCSPGSSG